VKAGKQIAAIKGKRLFPIVGIQRRLEFVDVAPHGLGFHSHVVTARDDQVVAKLMTKEGESDAETRSGVLAVRFWPEQSNQPVPPVESARVREDKVGKERETLGLCDDPGRRTPLWRSQVN
jgi:hypothetical protein